MSTKMHNDGRVVTGESVADGCTCWPGVDDYGCPVHDPMLDKPIGALDLAIGLAARARGAIGRGLDARGLPQTVRGLTMLTRLDLIQTPGVGQKALAAVEKALAAHGLGLAGRS